MQVIGTGLSGLVGTRIRELLPDIEFTDMSLDTGVNITEPDQVLKTLEQSPARIILHMAAKTDVDGCEDDKILGEEGAAWMINVGGTQNIIDAALKLNKRIIYISTDFVFNGTKDFYTEDDEPDPLNWYGVTKHEAENLIRESGVSYAIARLAYPYRASFPLKFDFVRKIVDKAKKGGKIMSLTDHIFTPTFIDDIALGLNLLIKRNVEGVFHLVGGTNLTPFEATAEILKQFNLKAQNEAVTREIYFKDRAFRPFKLALKNDKISKLGVSMHSFDRGLAEVIKQQRLG